MVVNLSLLPAFSEGARTVIAQTDIGNAVFELNEANNTLADDASITLGRTLTFGVLPTIVGEEAGSRAATGQVSRTGSTAAALVVTLATDSGELSLPASVTIPAGQSSASFAVGVTGNVLVDGTRTATLTASAAGFNAASSTLRITDDDRPALTVTLPSTTALEGAPVFQGTVFRNGDTTAPLTVTLGLDKDYKATIPPTVTIAAGSRTAQFDIRLTDDTLVEGARNLRFSATAAGYVTGSAELTAYDDDVPTLSLRLGQNAVSEGNAAGTTLTVTRNLVSDQALEVLLRADGGQLRLPSRLVIASGQASATATIDINDNGIVDGARVVVIRADVADSVLRVAIPTTNVQTGLTILDDDGPTLALSFDRALVNEGGTATGTVTRNTPTTADLIVALTSSDSTEADIPATVTILAGQSSASFTLSGVNDGITDGTRPVTVLVQAGGFNSGSAGLSVTDRDIADLLVTGISLPPVARTGAPVSMQFTVSNRGFGATDGSWKDRVYVSADAVLDESDVLVTSMDSTPLGIGESYTRTASFIAGNRAGPVYVIVVSDPQQALSELLDNNNQAAAELNVAPAYRAIVSTETEVAPAGTRITMQGTATSNLNGQPQANSLVTIQVKAGDTIRNISTFTNSEGRFTAFFTPLAGEAGRYTISADHPGVVERLPQDSFVLVGLRAEPQSVGIAVVPGTPTEGDVTIRNLADIPLTGLTARVSALPPVLDIVLTAPPTIAANGTIQLHYVATSTATGQTSGTVTFALTTAEGAVLNVPVNVTVTPLTPRLLANPGYLEAGMLRGEQKLVSFEVVNQGGAATGPLTLLLPNFPWLSPANGTSFASLGAGEKITVSLLLAPGADLPLGMYNGSVVLNGSNTTLSVAFQFRAISEAVGDVVINVQDEYTFYADGQPPLAGARVTLTDPYTSQVVATGVSGEDGKVRFSNIREGQYQLSVSAEKHDGLSGAFQVNAGVTNEKDIFLHRQVVTYKWTVVPIEFTDRYKIVLETVFETEVPMPVVTVDEPRLMPIVIPGQTTQMQITLRNHGLIAAEQVQVRVPNDPDLIITPLIDYIPILPAKSSVTVPITVRMREGSPMAASLAASAANGVRPTSDISALGSDIPIVAEGWGNAIAKCLGIDTVYTYECQNGQWVSVPVKLDAIFCAEDIAGAGSSLLEHISDPTRANAASLGCDVLGAILQCAGFDDCTQAIASTVCGVGLGALTGGAAGAGAGALGALDDILACLCSIDFGPGDSGGGTGDGGPSGFGIYGGSIGSPWGTSVIWDGGTVSCGPASSAAELSDGAVIAQASNGVCAQVRLKLEQEAVITRTAFLGTLEMDNGTAGTLSGIQLLLDIRDDNGEDANGRFFVIGPDATVMTRNADGTYSLPPGATGKLAFTFLPTVDAATDAPTRYAIGGTLKYVDGGNTVQVPLLSSRITVYPEARLKLDYFWQRDVKGDDPFTDAVEASEPFALGLQVLNEGKGAAKNLTIVSAQPKVVENEKGLLIDFKIVSSQVNATPATPSLTIDLGRIDPGQLVTGQWNMTSTLQGKFVDYKASFTHEDQFGGLRTSLIDSVSIHELIRQVSVNLPTQDNIPDYLTNDVADPDHAPDTLWLSTGGQVPVSLATNVRTEGGGASITLRADVSAGWTYLKVTDPLPGMELVGITRSDGRVISVAGMSWRTDRTFRPGEPGATNENLLHLVDRDSTGVYTLAYRVIDRVAPALAALEQPAAVRSTPVASLDATFSEALDPASIGGPDLVLVRDGVTLDTSGLVVTAQGGGVYRFSGLAALTGGDGNYSATVRGATVADPAGNTGTGTQTSRWAMAATSLVATALEAVPGPRNTAVASLEVSFSRAVDPASFDAADLTLTRDGTPLVLDAVVVTQVAPDRFRVDGLAGLTGTAGLYALTLRGAGVLDTLGGAGTGVLTQGWVTDTTAPTAVLDSVFTNPRNIVVPELGITFSEAIRTTDFTLDDLRLSRDGGANLINPAEVTIVAVDATHYLIRGINWPQSIGGTYALTVNMAGIADLAGNAGAGTVATSWVMDIAPPPVAYNLRITPDTGSSNTDGRTTATSLSLLGDLGEDGLTVRLRDMTTSTELGEAVVTGRSFAGAITFSSLGTHQVRVRAVDAAGNTADAFYSIFVDVGGPVVTAISAVTPALRTTPVEQVTVRFNGPVAAGSFGLDDVTLTRDGTPVDLTGVTITPGADNSFVLSGLAGPTGQSGAYVLSVSGVGVTDDAGNDGSGTQTVAWTRVAALDVGLRGTVFDDSDGDGVKGVLEAGIASVTIFIDVDGNGVAGDAEARTTTDAFGNYSFLSLAAGTYRLVSVVEGGAIATGPASGFRDVTVVAERVTTGVNFGRFLPGEVRGVKFIDADADGVRDAGEAGLAGVTLFVDKDGDGVLDVGETSTVTAADGSYALGGIGPGIMRVGEVVRDGWTRTTPAAAIRITSGLRVTGADVGNVQLGSLSGAKFEDSNGNGERDAGERGLANWTIFLDVNGDGILQANERRVLTDADGRYSFADLLPGSYTIAEEQKEGWVQTTPLGSPSGSTTSTLSEILIDPEGCYCGTTWSVPDGTPLTVDLGARSTRQARDLTGLTAALQTEAYSHLTGQGIRTVLIDTGIDVDHPFFGSDADGNGVDDSIVYQWDFADNDGDASDRIGHGSHVATMIASRDSRYTGVATGTDLIVLKVFSDSGRGTFGYVEQALQWVLANADAYNIGVVNLSLGDNGNWQNDMSRYGLGDEFAALAGRNVITVAASGNSYNHFNQMGVAYPASDPAVLAVGGTWSGDFGGPWTVATGATDYTTGADRIAAFSQRSDTLLDIFAPGARFNGANATGGVHTMQGTSQAAGFVSGAAALAQQLAVETLGHRLSTADFATLLKATGDLVVDGDDENDNVTNTGLSFPRVQFEKLFAAISAYRGDAATGGGTGGGGGGGSDILVPPRPTLAAPGVQQVVLGGGAALGGLDFGNYRLTAISGTVFGDANGDGLRGGTEAVLAGRTVFLDQDGDNLRDAGERFVVTGADGAYSFADIGPGARSIMQEIPAGWTATTANPLVVLPLSGQPLAADLGSRLTNTAPVAVADSRSVSAGAAVQLDLLANDTDPNGDPLAVLALPARSAQGAALSIEGGLVRYNPLASGPLTALLPGRTATDSFTYTITDGRGGTASALVTLTLTGVNDAPVANADAASIDEDTATAIDVLANDTDPDQGAVLAAGAVAARSAQGAALSLDATGRLLYDPRGAAALQKLAAGETLTDSFTYTVRDVFGLASTGTVTVQVAGRNDAPVAAADTATTDEDSTVLVAVLANDRDPDAGAVLGVGAVQGTSDLGAAVTIQPDGRVLYDPRGAATLQALTFGQNATDRFTYTVSDGLGGTASASVTVAVVGRQDRQIALLADTSEDAAASIPVPDIVVTGVARSTLGAAVSLDAGGLLYDPRAASRLQALNPGQTATDTVLFSGRDALGEPVTGSVTVTVTGANDAPTAGYLQVTTDAATAIVAAVIAAARDADAGASLSLVGTAALSARGAAVSIVDGALRYDPTGSAQLAGVLVDERVTDSVTYTVADNTGATVTGTLRVVVDGTRVDAGTVTFASSTTTEDAAISLPLSGPWVLRGVNSLSDLGASVGTVAGTLRYNPTATAALQALRAGESVTETISFTVASTLPGQGGVLRRAQMQVVVTGLEDAPIANADNAGAAENVATTLDVVRNDTDADRSSAISLLSVAGTSEQGAGLALRDGKVVYDPTGVASLRNLATGATITDRFTYVVQDETGLTATGTVTVVVTGRNDAPVAIADGAAADEDTVATLIVLSNDTDRDSAVLAIRSVQAISAMGATVAANPDGTLRYDPRGAARIQALAADATATDSFTYVVEDEFGATARTTVTVTLTGRNDAPTAVADAAATNEDTLVTITVLANDLDVDRPAGLVTSLAATSSVKGARLAVDAQGRVTYDPRGLFDALAFGETTTDSFEYTVTDAGGATSTATVSVVITGRNDAPVARNDVATVAANGAVIIDVLANDSDPDNGDVLRIDQVVRSTRGVLATITADGKLSYDPTGLVSVPPGQTRTDTFSYFVTDGSGVRSRAVVTVTITAPGPAPLSTEVVVPQRVSRLTQPAAAAQAEIVIDLAAAYSGTDQAAPTAPGWQAAFVAAASDPNRDLAVTMPRAA